MPEQPKSTKETKKPKSVEEYKVWLRDQHGVDLQLAENHYESVRHKLLADVKESSCWRELLSSMDNMDQTYLGQTGYKLFAEGYTTPQLRSKPFESLLIKTFRRNILANKQWPEPPTKTGWLLPPGWFARINDIVRTLLVVKYLDGVTFTVKQIRSIVRGLGTECSAKLEAREEGYYAAHLYFHVTCEIPRENWDTVEAAISVELQVTTQVQEVIRKLLHAYYEERRLIHEKESTWQWDYKTPEFAANYLGHVLHYVEGMIMDIREKQETQKT